MDKKLDAKESLESWIREVPGKSASAIHLPIKRNTVQKNLIVKALHELNHPSADNVYAYVSTDCPSISRATVYRNLKDMSESGEILLVEVANGADHFDHTLAPHYHFHCTKCGEIYDVDLPYQTGLNQIKSASGFEIENHMLLFTGTCPKCHN